MKLHAMFFPTLSLLFTTGCRERNNVENDPQQSNYPLLIVAGRALYSDCVHGLYQYGENGFERVACADEPESEMRFGTVPVPAAGSPTLGWTRRGSKAEYAATSTDLEPVFTELHRYSRTTKEDEVLTWMQTSSENQGANGSIGLTATLADGSIIVGIGYPGEHRQLTRFIDSQQEAWLGVESDAEVIQRIDHETVLIKTDIDGVRWWATIANGSLTPIVEVDAVGELEGTLADAMLFRDDAGCAVWLDGTVRRPNLISFPETGRRLIGLLPTKEVLLRLEDENFLWDAEDDSVPQSIADIPNTLDSYSMIALDETTAVAWDNPGDKSVPGFLKDGVWTACDGPEISQTNNALMLLEDPELQGIVYEETDHEQTNDGTLYICTPDGEVDSLTLMYDKQGFDEEGVVKLRVLGNSTLGSGTW